jgi:hypothetical protein
MQLAGNVVVDPLRAHGELRVVGQTLHPLPAQDVLQVCQDIA